MGQKVFTTITMTIIATMNPITWAGESMNFELYSSSYLINPPKTPGICIVCCCDMAILEIEGI